MVPPSGSPPSESNVTGQGRDLSLRAGSRVRQGRHLPTGAKPVFFFFALLFRATAMAHGGSQARGPIRAAAAGLRHSCNNARSELHLQPTPQLMAMLAP